MMATQKSRGRPQNKDRQLDQALIIYMAKTLMRDEGKVPSIRGIARALEVDAMSIYHYFENKNSLLEAILISLMDGIYCPQQKLPWRQSLQLLAESYLNLLRNYKGLLETLISMSNDGPKMIFTTRFSKIIAPINLPVEKQQQTLLLLLSMLHGLALLPHDDDNSEFTTLFKLYCSLLRM